MYALKPHQELPKPLFPKLLPDTGGSEFECSCGQRFKNQASLFVHATENPKLNSHTRPLLAMEKLEYPASFNRPDTAALKSKQLDVFFCELCHKSFKRKLGLQQHLGKVHNQAKKRLPCTECGKKFKDKHAVKYHRQQVHSEATRSVCKLCGELCYNKYSLQRHLKHCVERKKLLEEAET